MTDYSQLSDRDIDALVLQKVYGNQASDKGIMRAWLSGGFKYTTNPADAWPIIIENKISLIFDASTEEGNEAEWCLASSPCDQIIIDYVTPDKMIRAAMIVFLMMKDAENAPAI